MTATQSSRWAGVGECKGTRGRQVKVAAIFGPGGASGLVRRFNSPSLRRLAHEYPTVALVPGAVAARPIVVKVGPWLRGQINLYQFDRLLDDQAEQRGVCVLLLTGGAGALPVAARQVLTRCQRWAGRRNVHSSSEGFGQALAVHRALHDLSKPLVRADFNHALDVWQWVLRLCPGATMGLQLAALFHDIERLYGEPEQRREHLAPDYQAFKHKHAGQGAAIAQAVLMEAHLDAPTRTRVASLIAHHEQPGAGANLDGELAVLGNADALSFFSLNSHGYYDYFGPAQTRCKVEYTLRRMQPRCWSRLRDMHLRPEIRQWVRQWLQAQSEPAA